jgi:Glycoside-hydrolase family GH114
MKTSIIQFALFSSALAASLNKRDVADSPWSFPPLSSWFPKHNKPGVVGTNPVPAAAPIAPSIVPSSEYESRSIWQPAVASKFQIILYKGGGDRFSRSSNLMPEDAEIFDLDLFDTTKSTIQKLHNKGKRVICYFSAGSAENWRSDFSKFQAKDKGDHLREWQKEQWVDIRSPEVFDIMKSRMQLGAEKGCDAVDADNVGMLLLSLVLLC